MWSTQQWMNLRMIYYSLCHSTIFLNAVEECWSHNLQKTPVPPVCQQHSLGTVNSRNNFSPWSCCHATRKNYGWGWIPQLGLGPLASGTLVIHCQRIWNDPKMAVFGNRDYHVWKKNNTLMGKTMIIIHRRGCPLNSSNYISPYIGSHVDLKKTQCRFADSPSSCPVAFNNPTFGLLRTSLL